MTSHTGWGIDHLLLIVGLTGLIGSALVAGIFFAFSSFVMKALADIPFEEGIRAMQSINVVVLNPSFLGLFIGTTVLSLVTGGVALANWGHPSAAFLSSAATFYVVGTFLVTAFGNVPLNDHLATVIAADPGAHDVWEFYLDRWTRWNHIRTGAAIGAALLFGLGVLQSGGT